jgi:hypothetical protein
MMLKVIFNHSCGAAEGIGLGPFLLHRTIGTAGPRAHILKARMVLR